MHLSTQTLSGATPPSSRLRPGLVRLLRAWMKPALLAAVGLAGAGAMAPCTAQAAEVTLPARATSRGLRSGDFVLTPSLGIVGHHDTNLFNADESETARNPIIGATSIRFLPALGLTNDSDGNVSFTFNAAGDARIYLNDNEAVQSVQTVGGRADLDVEFGRRKPISFALSDNFSRVIRANNWETPLSFNRNSNTVGARVSFHPGSVPERRPFNLTLAGTYTLDRFDDFGVGDADTIGTRLTSSWRFLPKTALLFDSGLSFRTLQNQTLVQNGMTSSSMPFRARAGISGAITQRISAQLMAGWGLSNHEKNESFNGLLAGVGVGFELGDSTRLNLNYEKDFRDSLFGNYASVNRISAGLRQRFGHLMDVDASFGVAFVTYGLFTPLPGIAVEGVRAGADGKSGYRDDVNLDGRLSAQFEISRLIGLNVGYLLRGVQTPFRIIGQTGSSNAGQVLDAGAFIAHEISAGVTLRY